MSINKVLNRPMFRQQALKRGHLKPIHAQTGVMVGGAPTQNITAMQYRPPMVIDQPTLGQRFKTGVSRFVSDVKNFPKSLPGQIKSPTTRVPYGLGGGIGRLLGVEGIYSGVSNATTKLGMQPGMLKNIADFGATGLLALNPYARAAGLGYSAFRMARPVVGGAVDYLTQKPAGTTAKALTVDMGEPIAPELFKPIDPAAPKNNRRRIQNQERTKKMLEEKGIKSPTAAEIAQVEETGFKVSPRRKQVLERMKQKDVLTQADNETKIGNNTVVDSNKVATNTGLNEVPAPDLQFDEGDMKMPPLKDASPKVEEKDESDKNLTTVDSGQSGAASGKGKVKAGDGTDVTDDTIARAREIRDQLMAGKSSQAGLVFLANLASGLLSGTTAKAGIGGALEVLGKALGPAVNNYATIKLKENELENEFMSDALELASEEIEAKNATLEAPDYPDATSGVVRMFDVNNQPINVTARRLKDGTVQIAYPGQVDQNGRQVFQTVTPGEYITFRTAKGAEKGQFETLRDLSAKYKAYQLGVKTIDILNKAKDEGKKFAGPAGRFNLFTTRLNDALSDFGINIGSAEDGFKKAQELRSDMKQGLINDGMSEDDAEKYLTKQFGSTEDLKNKILKQLGSFADQTDSANLERLAINETVMVYALANSLKAKDRLTQKDIQMAKDLVNIFPLLRGQSTVTKSLNAVNETILSDIRRLETDYQDIYFGDSYTINKYRQTYGLLDKGMSGAAGELQNPFRDLSVQELLEQY
jgi:hypothetical protein